MASGRKPSERRDESGMGVVKNIEAAEQADVVEGRVNEELCVPCAPE